MTRRSLLVLGGGALVTGVPLARAAARWVAGDRDEGLFLTASDDLDGRHYVGATDARGAKRFSIEVDQRCHAFALDPVRPGRAVAMARRPGTAAYDIDFRAGTLRRRVQSAADRHFYGHAVFSPDGSVLYTSENDVPRGQGVVAVRDGQDLRVLHEIETHGVGPHAIELMADGKTLVVANGGLVTDLPDGTGRRRDLNVPNMDPSLVYLDVRDGKLLAQVRPDDHFASIRHLAIAADGTVGVAMQYEGPETNPYPVIGFQRGDGPVRTVEAPREALVRMRRYTASIALAPSGIAAATCPRGDTVALVDVASGALARLLEIRDAGGVALSPDGRHFVVSTGFGELHVIDARTLEQVRAPVRDQATRWDNHLVQSLAV